MYLTTRDTPAESTPIDKKGQDSRIVLVIIGSTILLVIVVCLVIQPIRQLHSQMRERRLIQITDQDPCPELAHTHSHTDITLPANIPTDAPNARGDAYTDMTKPHPILATLPILTRTQNRPSRPGPRPLSPTHSRPGAARRPSSLRYEYTPHALLSPSDVSISLTARAIEMDMDISEHKDGRGQAFWVAGGTGCSTPRTTPEGSPVDEKADVFDAGREVDGGCEKVKHEEGNGECAGQEERGGVDVRDKQGKMARQEGVGWEEGRVGEEGKKGEMGELGDKGDKGDVMW